jgi:hypothetical protein
MRRRTDLRVGRPAKRARVLPTVIPTSWPNLDLVRSIYAAWERGDYSSTEWADPEIEYVIVEGPAPGTWTGMTGMPEGMRDWLRAWDDFRIQAEEYRELGGERVLATRPTCLTERPQRGIRSSGKLIETV